MIYDKGKNNKTNYLNLMESQRISIYNTQRRKIAIVREAMSQVQLKMVDVYITPDGRIISISTSLDIDMSTLGED